MRIIRQLEANDRLSYLELLKNLTVVGEISEEDFNQKLHRINENPVYEIHIIYDTEKEIVVATGTLLIEEKFIHQLGKVAHLEDIVVNPDYQGQGLGKRIIMHLVQRSREVNCYKVILDCLEDVAPFYRKCGFKVNGCVMRNNL